MKKGLWFSILISGAIVLGLMVNHLQAFEILTKEDFVNRVVVNTQLIRMAENAIILFDYDQSDIRPEFRASLDKLGRFLVDHPEAYVVLAGYTCDMGSMTTT